MSIKYASATGPPPRPPTNVQNYGPQIQGPDHRTAQPYFQYSQCTGKRKALCIGINYYRQAGELRGCINDARNIQRFLCGEFNTDPTTSTHTNPMRRIFPLQARGYRNAHRWCPKSSPKTNEAKHCERIINYIVEIWITLTYDQIQAMQWLAKDARPNDSLFFHCTFRGARLHYILSFCRLWSWWSN